MSVIGYARCTDNSDVGKAKQDMRKWCSDGEKNGRLFQLDTFDFDYLSGKRGLLHTLRALKSGDTLLIRHLSNLGRTPHELLRNANELLAERGVDVVVVSTNLQFVAGAEKPDTRVFAAILSAHDHYVQENIRRGVQAAKAGGAIVGRPPRRDLMPDRVSERIGGLRNAKAGRLPSVRELMKELGCGMRKASELLNGYKAKEAAAR